MVERGHFIPTGPSEQVLSFGHENPHADWKTSLAFLQEHFPQVVNGKVLWLPDGGTATKLHRPYSERHEPRDVDLITPSEDMTRKFGGVINKGDKKDPRIEKFDVRATKYWLTARGFQFTSNIESRLMNAFDEVEFNGKPLLILKEDYVVMSKLRVFDKKGPRESDIADIRHFNIPFDKPKEAFKYLGGAKGGFRVPAELLT